MGTDEAQSYQDWGQEMFRRGYKAGWDDHQKFLADHQRLQQDVNEPGSHFMFALVMIIFGGMFLATCLLQYFRFGNVLDWGFWAFALGPLTLAAFILRGLPKARARAREARAKFAETWK